MSGAIVKHGGCSDCKAKDEPVLTSVTDPQQHLQSKAVCSRCFPKYEESRR